MASRAPHGARGLKWLELIKHMLDPKSRPAWGAWIEMSISRITSLWHVVAPRMGRVD